MSERRQLFGKLNRTQFRAIESATAFAKLRGNPYVELVHWVHQLLRIEDGDLQRILRHFEIDRETVDRDLASALIALPAGATSLSDFSHHIDRAAERAWVLASLEFRDRSVRGAWLVLALLRTPDLRRVLLAASPVFAKIPAELSGEALAVIVSGSPEDREGPCDDSGGSGVLSSGGNGVGDGTTRMPAQERSSLARYCIDLTARAASGAIDPVIGRAHEISTLVDILLRRRQNNPLLTGDAGVGKTAVVEGLARAIVAGDVPPALRDVRLLSLDLGALLAGASMRGEFEARLKTLLEEASCSLQPVVLFIDEVHALVGAGGQAGTGDAANMLKPALARGALRVVGATTWSEYKRYIERDAALARRFQVLQVTEPQEDAAIEMVRGLVPAFAAHHGVMVLDEAVRAAVVLSRRYIPARQLPDKAISLLDTACARVAMSLHAPPAAIAHLRQRREALDAELELLGQESVVAYGSESRRMRMEEAGSQRDVSLSLLAVQEATWHGELGTVRELLELRRNLASQAGDEAMPVSSRLAALESELKARQQERPMVFPQVDAAVVASIVADWTGIPVGRMLTNDLSAVLQLQATLERRVMGQPAALRTIAERVQAARARLTDPDKPVGVFLLVGPSGVGKTETAMALADAMHGGEQNLITINMSEFQEPHTVSTLKGAPPGYVGYGEGGVLSEAVRRKPYSVILLDEVEKAHPDVHEIFYQVFDKGWMEDGEGRRIDFRNTTILLTSNVGSESTSRLCDGAVPTPDAASLCDAMGPALRQAFPTAFLGRLTIVPYFPLDEDVLDGIVALQLDRLSARMRAQHAIDLVHAPELRRHIIDRCVTQETGARRLIAFIEQQLLPVLSGIWLTALQEKKTVLRIAVGLRSPGSAELGAEGAQMQPRADREVIACQIEYA